MKKKFCLRGFISLFVVFLFLIMSVSGIILYISPSIRVTVESGWNVFGLNKYQWRSMHTIFTFFFIIAVMFHLFFNWRPLLFYFRRKLETHIKLRKEFLSALSLSLFLFILLLYDVPPFSTIMAMRDDFTFSVIASDSEIKPPAEAAPVDTAGICIAEKSSGNKSCRDCTLETCVKTKDDAAENKPVSTPK